ncbi:MAG: tRNA-dihydrouridine synthase B [Candidatus Woesearchaeota archaeon]
MRSKSDFPKLSGRAVLSPMSGVTDVAFRTLCKRYGAALTYTEFISSTAIVRGNLNTLKMLETDKSEDPVAVQLFGSSIRDVVDAAKLIEDRFDIIDVNCGCPAWKVVKTGAGSEMLKEPKKVASFINKLAESVSKPVTVKIRAGIDDDNINAIEVAKLVEDAGAAAIAIHGRTQKQGYRGVSNWDLIKQVKAAVSIPVIGNGDVFSPETLKQRLEESGVDYVMVARGAIGNPFIFTQMNQFLATGKYDEFKRIEAFSEYLELALTYEIDFSSVKQHALTFTKGMQGGAHLRQQVAQVKTIEELQEQLQSYL